MPSLEWRASDAPVPYPKAIAEMEDRVAAIRAGEARELIWLLEHPPLYTAGTSAKDGELLTPDRLPVFRTGRGGQYTYHGPGQRIAYVMVDLRTRGHDLRRHVRSLEELAIRALAAFGVRGERRPGRVGIWVDRGAHGGPPGRENKIAAIGVRVRHWITYHGVSINVDPALEHYAGIVPCGLDTREFGVTSLADLGRSVTLSDLDRVLRSAAADVFGVRD